MPHHTKSNTYIPKDNNLPSSKNRKLYRKAYAKLRAALGKPLYETQRKKKVQTKMRYYNWFLDYASDCGHMTPRHEASI